VRPGAWPGPAGHPSPVERVSGGERPGPDERPGPRIAAVLESLAWQRASGVLEIDGDPAGAVYLECGEITFAQSSWSPPLAARLGGILAPGAELPGQPPGQPPAGGPDDASLAQLVLERGWVTREGLAALLRSVIVDAILVLTVPLAADSAVSGVRFEAPRAHWAASLTRLDMGQVRGEAVARAGSVAWATVPVWAALALQDMTQTAAVLSPPQWALACVASQGRALPALARLAGLALYEVLDAAGGLIEAGLGAARPAGPGETPAPGTRERAYQATRDGAPGTVPARAHGAARQRVHGAAAREPARARGAAEEPAQAAVRWPAQAAAQGPAAQEGRPAAPPGVPAPREEWPGAEGDAPVDQEIYAAPPGVLSRPALPVRRPLWAAGGRHPGAHAAGARSPGAHAAGARPAGRGPGQPGGQESGETNGPAADAPGAPANDLLRRVLDGLRELR
jgi:Domain of unknown function (DUF4388)